MEKLGTSVGLQENINLNNVIEDKWNWVHSLYFPHTKLPCRVHLSASAQKSLLHHHWKAWRIKLLQSYPERFEQKLCHCVQLHQSVTREGIPQWSYDPPHLCHSFATNCCLRALQSTRLYSWFRFNSTVLTDYLTFLKDSTVRPLIRVHWQMGVWTHIGPSMGLHGAVTLRKAADSFKRQL